MIAKQSACTPTWNMPNSPAKQENPSISLQQAMSSPLLGSTRMFEKEKVPDVVPSKIKYGDIPKEDRRDIIL